MTYTMEDYRRHVVESGRMTAEQVAEIRARWFLIGYVITKYKHLRRQHRKYNRWSEEGTNKKRNRGG